MWCWWLQDSVILGKKMAAGGFGTVFRGSLLEDNGNSSEVVIKKVRSQQLANG
jgi:hypothetical protein